MHNEVNSAVKFCAFAAVGALAAFALPQAAHAQKANGPSGLQISGTTSATALVNAILGDGVTAVGTATLVGQSDDNGAQQGLFTTIGPDVLGSGFSQGIVLTSGYASNVIGPNESTATTKSWGSAGDPDLDTLTTGTTNDANSLTFDFTVNAGTNQLNFNYVFGSEEYNEFVGSQFNDVFGFFVDGKNIALIPGSDAPVTINSVNNNSNSGFYRDNTPNDSGVAPINTELDGLTTVLTANVFDALDPNKVVHEIKLTVGDTSDTAYDSAVFIKASSFSVVTPMPEAGTSTGFGLGLVGLLGMMFAARRRRVSSKI